MTEAEPLIVGGFERARIFPDLITTTIPPDLLTLVYERTSSPDSDNLMPETWDVWAITTMQSSEGETLTVTSDIVPLVVVYEL